MSFFNSFFLLKDYHTGTNEVAVWRISTLRIIIVLAMLLSFAVMCHTFNAAIEFNVRYIIAVTISFFSITCLVLIYSKRFYRISAHVFLVSIVAGSLCMNLFLTDLQLAKVGSMYMYACPILALMLLDYKTSLVYSLLNIVPFYMIINNINISGAVGFASQLPNANLYITGLVFLFFNICIPLGLTRTIVAAKRLNETMHNANSHLKEKNELYRGLFTESNKAKVIVDENLIITDFNERASEVFDIKYEITEQDVSLLDIFSSITLHNYNEQNQIIQYKNRYFKASYQQIAINLHYRVYDFYDCTQEQLVKQNLSIVSLENKQLRYRNAQTKLPNRQWFEMQCDKLTAKHGKAFYIVITQSANNEYFNLKLSQTHAHALQINAYKRLKSIPDGPHLCAHVGIGKLAFIIDAQTFNDLQNSLFKIKTTLDKSYNILGTQCQQSFLFGFAKYPKHGDKSAIVLNNACKALNLADSSLPLSGYNEKHSQAFIEKYEISMLLDEAIKKDQLAVHYQPKVNAQGECVGLEALARWKNDKLGDVSPAVFIPIAEEYRMISRLTDLVIKKVCKQINYWSKSGVLKVPVAINISLVDFSQTDFMPTLVKHLAGFDVKPNQIELELTETSLEANQEHSLKLIETLQGWGFTISVDDFGVGYSNIARLAEYPINKLKLDRSLISQVTTSSRQKSLVKAVHVMCEELGIKCVAEGVETQEQVTIMEQMGCKEFQGFFFAKPMAANALEKYVKEHGFIFTSNEITATSIVH